MTRPLPGTVTFVFVGPSMSFPIIAFSGDRTLSISMRRLRHPRLIWAGNRMPMMTSAERKMIFFMITSLQPSPALF
jgi:hypothetical protein